MKQRRDRSITIFIYSEYICTKRIIYLHDIFICNTIQHVLNPMTV